jgi:hypothetical protein
MDFEIGDSVVEVSRWYKVRGIIAESSYNIHQQKKYYAICNPIEKYISVVYEEDFDKVVDKANILLCEKWEDIFKSYPF